MLPHQIIPEISLDAKMAILKLSYFGHIIRRKDSLQMTTMFGKIENNRKRRPNVRYIDPIKEAIHMGV